MQPWAQKRHLDIYYDQIPLIGAWMRMAGRAALQRFFKRKQSLNPSILGRVYPGRAIKVTPLKIEAYARATNETNPRYFIKSAQEKIVAPPMMAAMWNVFSMTRMFADKELKMVFSNMVHAGQDLEFFRLVRPGEEIFSKSFAHRIVDRGQGELLVANSVSLTRDGEMVSKGYSSWYIQKPEGLRTNHQEEFHSQLFWDAPPTQSIRPIDKVQVAENQSLRFARISGDYNFLHISDLVARALGNQRRILPGLCTMSFVAKALIDGVLDGEPRRLKRINMRFLKKILPGDILETHCWKIDPQQTPWSSEWLPPEESQTKLVGFKTVNQHGEIIVSRGVAKIAEK